MLFFFIFSNRNFFLSIFFFFLFSNRKFFLFMFFFFLFPNRLIIYQCSSFSYFPIGTFFYQFSPFSYFSIGKIPSTSLRKIQTVSPAESIGRNWNRPFLLSGRMSRRMTSHYKCCWNLLSGAFIIFISVFLFPISQ